MRPRKLAKVPFVELADGRLQGVVSSGSDVNRVYVSFFEVGTTNYSCSTNNNRPCGGARGSFCNHILALINEAVLQYGAERVARYLRIEIPDEEPSAQGITDGMYAARPPAYPRDGRRGATLVIQPLTGVMRCACARTCWSV